MTNTNPAPVLERASLRLAHDQQRIRRENLRRLDEFIAAKNAKRAKDSK